MSEPKPADPLAADAMLPPVEPPSAGFLLQLFVIPGVIVTIIVMLYWGVSRLAHGQADPLAEVQKIRRKNDGSWQAASNLADQLRSDRRLAQNEKLAVQLAAILEQEIAANQQDKEAVTLRYFLCKTLGEFEIQTGLPALLKAAMTARDPNENEVRLAALEAIALLSEKMRAHGGLSHPDLVPTLLKAAEDPEQTVRSRAAFAIGAIEVPGGKLTANLERLLSDPYPDARFNAATQLAHDGDLKSIEVLAEMLEPDDATVKDEIKVLQEKKRALIVITGLRASAALFEKHPTADLSALTRLIEPLKASPIRGIRVEAEKVSQLMAQ